MAFHPGLMFNGEGECVATQRGSVVSRYFGSNRFDEIVPE
jgi:hypothetical protein